LILRAGQSYNVRICTKTVEYLRVSLVLVYCKDKIFVGIDRNNMYLILRRLGIFTVKLNNPSVIDNKPSYMMTVIIPEEAFKYIVKLQRRTNYTYRISVMYNLVVDPNALRTRNFTGIQIKCIIKNRKYGIKKPSVVITFRIKNSYRGNIFKCCIAVKRILV
jgi:hypothetical protein